MIKGGNMDKQSVILAAFSTLKDKDFSPVQIQKLLFLIDKNIGDQIGGPFFQFLPYDYGPFDSDIYSVLNQLTEIGLLDSIETNRGWKRYRLTPNGIVTGQKALSTLDKKFQEYVSTLSKFVSDLTFSQLVSAIYKAYPEMKVNSVFRGL